MILKNHRLKFKKIQQEWLMQLNENISANQVLKKTSRIMDIKETQKD